MVAEKTEKKFRGPLFSAAPCTGRQTCNQVAENKCFHLTHNPVVCIALMQANPITSIRLQINESNQQQLLCNSMLQLSLCIIATIQISNIMALVPIRLSVYLSHRGS